MFNIQKNLLQAKNLMIVSSLQGYLNHLIEEFELSNCIDAEILFIWDQIKSNIHHYAEPIPDLASLKKPKCSFVTLYKKRAYILTYNLVTLDLLRIERKNLVG
jgi:hypothetical protein